MTISEAKKKWGISDKRMVSLLENDMIADISVDNGKLVFPEYYLIKIPKEGDEITAEYAVRSILEMCDKFGYVDNKLLEIKRDNFVAVITSMEEEGLIKKFTDKYPLYTNLNYNITEKGQKKLKLKKFHLVMLEIGFETKFFSLKVRAERE